MPMSIILSVWVSDHEILIGKMSLLDHSDKTAKAISDRSDKTVEAISDRSDKTAEAISDCFGKTAKAVSEHHNHRFDETAEETSDGSDKKPKKILAEVSKILQSARSRKRRRKNCSHLISSKMNTTNDARAKRRREKQNARQLASLFCRLTC